MQTYTQTNNRFKRMVDDKMNASALRLKLAPPSWGSSFTPFLDLKFYRSTFHFLQCCRIRLPSVCWTSLKHFVVYFDFFN